MTKKILFSLVVVGFFSNFQNSYAWDNHTLLTVTALRHFPELQQAPSVAVESLESLIQSESTGLARLLDDQEAWAKTHIPAYPERPDTLRFETSPNAPAPALRQKFLYALRINPTSRIALYLQKIPGHSNADPHSTPLPLEAVTLLPSAFKNGSPFFALRAGNEVNPLDVVSSAADEPDYGLDIGLWEDNSTSFGKIYGFGKQPFGNPALDFGSQAPFHMGFFHESPVVYKAAAFLHRTYPEWRTYQFLTLARFAFETGHPYWGWRFAGWGMHYLQDLTQPYHAQVLPGVSVPRMLLINLLDMLGYHRPKNDRVQLVSNRHLALENFGFHYLYELLAQQNHEATLIRTLEDTTRDESYPEFTLSSLRDSITSESIRWSSQTDRTLRKNLPRNLVSDPEYVFGVTQPDINVFQVLKQNQPSEHFQNMETLLIELMKQIGPQSRQYLRSIVH